MVTDDVAIVTPESRDHFGETRLLVVMAQCPFDACARWFSGSTHTAAREAMDTHFERCHPGVPPMTVDAIERRRKA